MTKVLLVGNGAREHAIAKKIVEGDAELYSFMSKENPGIADLSKEYLLGDLTDFSKLDKFNFVDYAIIGPEVPIAAGITDYLEDKMNIPTCAPRKAVAKIEYSKIFARLLLEKYKIDANPVFHVCHNIEECKQALSALNNEVAIKPDGLTGGKGVKVWRDHFQSSSEATTYAEELLKKDGAFIIEEKLVGKEFSLQVYTDGSRIVPMPIVRDYKRAYEGDKGPNTGSMGSYSLPSHTLPFLEKQDIDIALNVLKQTIEALYKETGYRYQGILYGQFMKTKQGVYLIEFNVRFGDPEAMNVLKLQETNFNEVCFSIIDNKLKTVSFEQLATVCVYVVPEGYPVNPVENSEITLSPSIDQSEIYYASVYRKEGKIFSTRSRSIGIVSKAQSLNEAKERVMNLLPKITGNIYYRRDIGEFV